MKKQYLAHQPRVDDLAFERGIAFVDQRRLDQRSGHRREAEAPELVQLAPGGVAAAHHLRRQLGRRDVDHAFPGRLQHAEAVVAVADHAAHQRRLEFHHRVPGHGHDVRTAFCGGREQHHRTRLEQAIDPGQGKGFFRHLNTSASLVFSNCADRAACVAPPDSPAQDATSLKPGRNFPLIKRKPAVRRSGAFPLRAGTRHS